MARFTDRENDNFYLRKSTDGGATWGVSFDISQVTDPTISVREPRIVGTPRSTNPAVVQDPNVAYIAWGTEINQYEHMSEGILDLDIWISRTDDLGETYSTPTLLAGGDAAQYESQIRTSPGGETMWAVWNEEDPMTGGTNAMFTTTADSSSEQ